jgi:hypothetical protein
MLDMGKVSQEATTKYGLCHHGYDMATFTILNLSTWHVCHAWLYVVWLGILNTYGVRVV